MATLTAAQAAARLGVKPATLYAYVSRGLIPRHRSADGRRSLFDQTDVERLAKRTPHSRLAPTDIVVPTSICLVDGERDALWYRGVDAVELSARHRFEAIAEFLWTGRLERAAELGGRRRHACARRGARSARSPALRRCSTASRLSVAAPGATLERSSDDPLATARSALACVIESLPTRSEPNGDSFAHRVYAVVSDAPPTPARCD